MVNQAILYGVGDFFFWGGNLVVAKPCGFLWDVSTIQSVFSTFQGRRTVIHVPRGVVVRELNEFEALELKDLDKVPLGGPVKARGDMVWRGSCWEFLEPDFYGEFFSDLHGVKAPCKMQPFLNAGSPIFVWYCDVYHATLLYPGGVVV